LEAYAVLGVSHRRQSEGMDVKAQCRPKAMLRMNMARSGLP
jgi:hypothetical protein